MVLPLLLTAALAAPPTAKPEPSSGDQLVLLTDGKGHLTGAGGTGHVTGTIGTVSFDARDDGVAPDFLAGDGVYTVVVRDLKGSTAIEIVARGMRWTGSADMTLVTGHQPLAVDLLPDGTIFSERAVPASQPQPPPAPSASAPAARPANAPELTNAPEPTAAPSPLVAGALALLGIAGLGALAVWFTRRRG